MNNTYILKTMKILYIDGNQYDVVPYTNSFKDIFTSKASGLGDGLKYIYLYMSQDIIRRLF